MLKLQERIDLMIRLGKYLSAGGAALKAAEEKAYRSNSWFIPRFIDLAVKNICDEFLREDKLLPWINRYPEFLLPFPEPRTRNLESLPVGIVMAGNIPLVGFHDFLCGFLSGHPLKLKFSSKDEVLLTHITEVLTNWNPALGESIGTAPLLKNCGAYIATGSDNSARYFAYYFAKYPHIIRRNRTSVAVLEGSETPEELEELAADIFEYFGLGCRNVTKIYVPEEYDFQPLLQAFRKYSFVTDYHHYKNNFDYNLALLLLNQKRYMSSDNLLLVENTPVFSPVSVLHYEHYQDKALLTAALRENQAIQCIAGRSFLPFGTTQQPGLADYADGVDTMQFLAGLPA